MIAPLFEASQRYALKFTHSELHRISKLFLSIFYQYRNKQTQVPLEDRQAKYISEIGYETIGQGSDHNRLQSIIFSPKAFKFKIFLSTRNTSAGSV